MKYLKLFESYDEIEVLKEFCKENIVLLLDIGFNINVIEHPGSYYIITLNKPNTEPLQSPHSFRWDDIKDDFITFSEILNEYYNISDVLFGNGYQFFFNDRLVDKRTIRDNTNYFKYEDIINDNVIDNIAVLNKRRCENYGITEPTDVSIEKLTSIGIIVKIK